MAERKSCLCFYG